MQQNKTVSIVEGLYILSGAAALILDRYLQKVLIN